MASNVPNPSVSSRHVSTWWAAPIGVGTVNSTPVLLADLPIADPHVVGQLWNLSGVIQVSNG